MRKNCLFCHIYLEKRVNESSYDYHRRRFCGKRCANTFVAHQKYGNPLTRTQKKCTQCKILLSLEEFGYNKRSADKHQSECKDCRKNYHYTRQGWTAEMKQKAFYKQQGKCEICKKKLVSWRKAAGDHNHKTGKARKLLCASCNHLLYILETPSLLEAATLYLKQHET